MVPLRKMHGGATIFGGFQNNILVENHEKTLPLTTLEQILELSLSKFEIECTFFIFSPILSISCPFWINIITTCLVQLFSLTANKTKLSCTLHVSRTIHNVIRFFVRSYFSTRYTNIIFFFIFRFFFGHISSLSYNQ